MLEILKVCMEYLHRKRVRTEGLNINASIGCNHASMEISYQHESVFIFCNCFHRIL